jgi:hypothetical protein
MDSKIAKTLKSVERNETKMFVNSSNLIISLMALAFISN